LTPTTFTWFLLVAFILLVTWVLLMLEALPILRETIAPILWRIVQVLTLKGG